MEKITYIAALNYAIETLTDAPTEIVEKLTALRDQTAKRNSAERKPTKAQQANEELKEVVLETLGLEPMTVTEVMAQDERLSALSNQKVSALVNALVRDGKALKVMDGRKSTFCRA